MCSGPDFISEIADAVEEKTRRRSMERCSSSLSGVNLLDPGRLRELVLERRRMEIISRLQRLLTELEEINERLRVVKYRQLFGSDSSH